MEAYYVRRHHELIPNDDQCTSTVVKHIKAPADIVYGLDINPRAIKISWINLYLNALDEHGQPIYDGEKKTLLDRVEFYESDLLAYCRDNHIELERIVGCIPQILNPNPDAMSKLITENASEEFLHSLSNYCALQSTIDTPLALAVVGSCLTIYFLA